MDAHGNEAAGAITGMRETYGTATATGQWKDGRYQWNLNDYVRFRFDGILREGQIVAYERDVNHDMYVIRSHVVGGGSQVFEVADTAIMLY